MTSYAQDASGYQQQYGTGHAMTKAEHDAIVAESGRPVTQDAGTRRRHRNVTVDPETAGVITVRYSENDAEQ